MPWTVKASVWTMHALDCELLSLCACSGLRRHKSTHMFWTDKAHIDLCTGSGLWRHKSGYICSGLRTEKAWVCACSGLTSYEYAYIPWSESEKAQVCVYALDWECMSVCSGLWRHKLEHAMLETHRRGTLCPKSTCKLYGTTLNTTHIAVIFHPKQKKAPHRWDNSHRF